MVKSNVSKEKNIDYFWLVKLSFSQFKQNLSLVVPTFFGLLLFFIFIIVALLQIGGFYLLFKNILDLKNIWLIFSSIPAICYIVLMSIVDLLLLFAIGAYTKSMQVSLIKDVVQKKNIEDANYFKKGKEFFIKYFKIDMLLFTLMAVPFFIVGLLLLWLYKTSTSSLYSPSWIIALILFVIFTIATVIYVLLLSYNLVFLDPLIVTKKLSPINTIKDTITYSLKNKKSVFMTCLYIFFVVVILLVVSFVLFDTPISALEKNKTAATSLVIFILQGINTLVQLVIGLVLQIFRFNSFFAKKD
jgi:hypothetical protein